MAHDMGINIKCVFFAFSLLDCILILQKAIGLVMKTLSSDSPYKIESFFFQMIQSFLLDNIHKTGIVTIYGYMLHIWKIFIHKDLT